MKIRQIITVLLVLAGEVTLATRGGNRIQYRETDKKSSEGYGLVRGCENLLCHVLYYRLLCTARLLQAVNAALLRSL